MNEHHGRMSDKLPSFQIRLSESHADRLRYTAQETIRQWSDILAWCESYPQARSLSFEARVILAAAKQFLAGMGGPGGLS